MLGYIFLGERRVLENIPSKGKQLRRSLAIVVIMPWPLEQTCVVLALFQVPTFDRLYLDTLNNIYVSDASDI